MVPRAMPSLSWVVVKDVVPQPRLEVALQLGQVEVGAGAARQQVLGVAEHVEAEVEEAGRDRLAVHQHVLFDQVPAARADQQGGDGVVELVGLAVGILERDRAGNGVGAVDLALDHVVPGGGERILKVGHEDLGARVEGVDHHLAFGGPGDLDAAVVEVGRGRGNLPVSLADVGGLGQEAGDDAGIEFLLPRHAPLQQFHAARVEGAVQPGHKVEGVGCQYSFHSWVLSARRHERRPGQSRS